jgi:hypothetical protein
MAQQESMNTLEFQRRFNTDDACRDRLFRIRRPEGLTCPKCGGTDFYKITARNIYECKCGRQVSLTAGTIMHGSHTPLRKWFWAVYLAAHDKRGVSALRLKKELQIAYQTAWLMLHKIRRAMGGRDGGYLLAGIAGMGETYVGGPKEGGKRGRGAEKTPVQAAVPLDEQGRPQYVKMEMLDDVAGQSIQDFAKQHIKEGSHIKSDNCRSYNKAFDGQPYAHEPGRYGAGENPEHLKRLHRIVGNAKTFMLGTYHRLGEKHLQAYLDEFCYRINRRQFAGQLFNRLLNACMTSSTITCQELALPVETG